MSGKVGDNVFRASGVVASAAAGISWQDVITASTFTAVAGNGYPVNTTSNACTVTLPAAASVGDEIIFTDYARNWGTNALTINQNSLKYQGETTPNPEYDTDGESVHIVYVDATQGWIPTYDGAVVNETAGAYIEATGPDDAAGAVASDDSDYKVHTFTDTKAAAEGFCVSNAGAASGSNTVEYNVVAGGGGGGQGRAGGGGAGGMRTASGLSVTVQNYAITIGDGGAGATSASAAPDGNASTALGIATVGGGGGGSIGDYPGSDGGSGGGAAGTGSIGEGTADEGNDGGLGASSPNYGAGGGGGKGAVGPAGTTTNGGDGGAGVNSSIGQAGTAIGYAGGGGGGVYLGGSGGTATHGGGNASATSGAGSAATVNTGGGGGGGGYASSIQRAGGAGGKGIVVIRYKFQN